MSEGAEVLAKNSDITWLAFMTYLCIRLLELFNDTIGALTGLFALILLILTCIGKYHEIKKNFNRNKGSDQSDS